MHYASYKDPVLRRKLAGLGIPSQGPRWLLEKRHLYWVNIWNANLDAAENPEGMKSTTQLLHELGNWEKAVTAVVDGGVNDTSGTPGPLSKQFNAGRWKEEHRDEYERLIMEARQSMQNQKEAAKKNETESE
jgi:E3 ubiquitin-protein ligase RAD18